MEQTNLVFEHKIWSKGIKLIAGIDEVGRGALAGPVYACAVILPDKFYHAAIRDSKKLSGIKREQLAVIIKQNAISIGIGCASEKEIDNVNIRQATRLAMRRSLEKLSILPEFLLIDGRDFPAADIPGKTIIGGDQRSFTISSASIIAKVARDNYMIALDSKYPEYGFRSNKGYGTKMHVEAIKLHGICTHHRKSFLTRIVRGWFESGCY